MRALLQRVSHASVTIENQEVSAISQGWLILLGVGKIDTAEDVRYLAEKCAHLRAFHDDAGKMNLSVLDNRGKVLVVSQFTLYGDCRKGRRPSFSEAAPPDKGKELYEDFCTALENLGIEVGRGQFGADMKVKLLNDGPVTFMLDSQAR